MRYFHMIVHATRGFAGSVAPVLMQILRLVCMHVNQIIETTAHAWQAALVQECEKLNLT